MMNSVTISVNSSSTMRFIRKIKGKVMKKLLFSILVLGFSICCSTSFAGGSVHTQYPDIPPSDWGTGSFCIYTGQITTGYRTVYYYDEEGNTQSYTFQAYFVCRNNSWSYIGPV